MPNDLPPKTDFTIDIDMVKHVASLVRLGITAEEAAAFAPQLNAIIDDFHKLNQVDTSDVPPACESASTRNVLRPDEVRPSMPRQDFLKNVPHPEGDFVHVPQVFGEE